MDYNPNIELRPNEFNDFGKSDYGQSLADEILKHEIIEDVAEQANLEYKERQLSKTNFDRYEAMEIITGFPSYSLIYNSPKQRVLLKGALGRLEREAHLDIGYSPKMSNGEMWSLYRRVLNILGVTSGEKENK